MNKKKRIVNCSHEQKKKNCSSGKPKIEVCFSILMYTSKLMLCDNNVKLCQKRTILNFYIGNKWKLNSSNKHVNMHTIKINENNPKIFRWDVR
jgi:hypothetical protein